MHFSAYILNRFRLHIYLKAFVKFQKTKMMHMDYGGDPSNYGHVTANCKVYPSQIY